jgi:hypothetical protein
MRGNELRKFLKIFMFFARLHYDLGIDSASDRN